MAGAAGVLSVALSSPASLHSTCPVSPLSVSANTCALLSHSEIQEKEAKR